MHRTIFSQTNGLLASASKKISLLKQAKTELEQAKKVITQKTKEYEDQEDSLSIDKIITEKILSILHTLTKAITIEKSFDNFKTEQLELLEELKVTTNIAINEIKELHKYKSKIENQQETNNYTVIKTTLRVKGLVTQSAEQAEQLLAKITPAKTCKETSLQMKLQLSKARQCLAVSKYKTVEGQQQLKKLLSSIEQAEVSKIAAENNLKGAAAVMLQAGFRRLTTHQHIIKEKDKSTKIIQPSENKL